MGILAEESVAPVLASESAISSGVSSMTGDCKLGFNSNLKIGVYY